MRILLPSSVAAGGSAPLRGHTARALLAAALLAAALLAAQGCSGDSGGSGGATITVPPPPPTPVPTGPVGPLAAGQAYTDGPGYVEYTPGDAPVLIIAPHGGALSPSGLADRTCSGCVTVNDANTQELARTIVEAFRARTGARPHLLVNRLHRRKFDANRDRTEATGGGAALNATWVWFHEAADSARAAIVRRGQRGLVIDLHGHGHAVPRLELGYLLGDADLRASDATLAGNGAMARSSIARLAGDSRSTPDRGLGVLRGPRSLGALLANGGYPAVPSPADPAPLVGQEYFDGGYNTQRHGSVFGGPLDAIQIECNFAGVRDSESSRAAFANAVVNALLVYLDTHYGWRPAA
jgi:hypothetical protein